MFAIILEANLLTVSSSFVILILTMVSLHSMASSCFFHVHIVAITCFCSTLVQTFDFIQQIEFDDPLHVLLLKRMLWYSSFRKWISSWHWLPTFTEVDVLSLEEYLVVSPSILVHLYFPVKNESTFSFLVLLGQRIYPCLPQ